MTENLNILVNLAKKPSSGKKISTEQLVKNLGECTVSDYKDDELLNFFEAVKHIMAFNLVTGNFENDDYYNIKKEFGLRFDNNIYHLAGKNIIDLLKKDKEEIISVGEHFEEIRPTNLFIDKTSKEKCNRQLKVEDTFIIMKEYYSKYMWFCSIFTRKCDVSFEIEDFDFYKDLLKDEEMVSILNTLFEEKFGFLKGTEFDDFYNNMKDKLLKNIKSQLFNGYAKNARKIANEKEQLFACYTQDAKLANAKSSKWLKNKNYVPSATNC